MDREMLELILAIVSGLAAAIPLVIKLIEYVQKTVKEKNWPEVIQLVMDLMATAETKFEENAERKEWVMAMLKASADHINYDIDYEVISDMIDKMCDMSKVVNATVVDSVV